MIKLATIVPAEQGSAIAMEDLGFSHPPSRSFFNCLSLLQFFVLFLFFGTTIFSLPPMGR